MDDFDCVSSSDKGGSRKKSGGSFGPMVLEGMNAIPWRLAAIVYLVYILVGSDVFINRILARVPEAVGWQDVPTTYGTMLMGLIVVGVMCAVILLDSSNCI